MKRHVCAACARPGLAPVTDTFEGQVLVCPGCKSLRLLRHVHAEASHDEYGHGYRERLHQAKGAALLQLFHHALGPHATPGRLLDIGCGDGLFLELARAEGWDVTGLDPDPRAVEVLRDKGIAATYGEAGTASDPGAPFDVVTLWDVLEHLDDPARDMAWATSLLRPGGKLCVVTPRGGSIFDQLAVTESRLTRSRSSRMMDLCVNRYHVHRMTAAGLTALARRCGLRPVLVRPEMLFSLHPSHYLSEVAPGVRGWSRWHQANRMASHLAFTLVRASRVANKLLFVGERVG